MILLMDVVCVFPYLTFKILDMRQFLIVLTLVLSFSCNTSTPEASTTTTSVTSKQDSIALIHLKEVEWPKAYREQDTVLLDRILGEDFQMIDNSGNWSTKRDELDWIKENAFKNDSFHYEIKRLDILPNGTALICGTGHVVNDSVKSIYQSSNILIKRNGVWKAVASHVSGYRNLE